MQAFRCAVVAVVLLAGALSTTAAAEDSSGAEGAVAGALKWLARHQCPDGRWQAEAFRDQCAGAKCEGPGNGEFDAGVTGLALLAFLRAGYTHLSKETVKDEVTGKEFEPGKVVMKAIRWIVNNQDPDGCVGPSVSKLMYNEATCALALSEAYERSDSQILKEPAQKGVDFLVAAKNPYKAWRYTPKCGENDTCVTGWCVMALKMAELSNLSVGHSSLVEAREFVQSVTDKGCGKCGYQSLEDAGVKVVVVGKNEASAPHYGLEAMGMHVRWLVDHDRKDPCLEMGAKLLSTDLPAWDLKKNKTDYCYWYYGTLALAEYDGPNSGGAGKYWKTWSAAVLDALLKNQKDKSAGCACGSWDSNDRWGFAGGRVYATAMNALTLETIAHPPSPLRKPDRKEK